MFFFHRLKNKKNCQGILNGLKCGNLEEDFLVNNDFKYDKKNQRFLHVISPRLSSLIIVAKCARFLLLKWFLTDAKTVRDFITEWDTLD